MLECFEVLSHKHIVPNTEREIQENILALRSLWCFVKAWLSC